VVAESLKKLLEKTHREPFAILTAPCVLKEDKDFLLYYVSGEGWENRDLPYYNIKYGKSKDGIHWERNGDVAIDFKSQNETALARPCVIKDTGIYKMFYSYKDPALGYRIGYAESKDGFNWDRLDEKIDLQPNPYVDQWDSQMVEYSYVLHHKGLYYMFYNGNNYGETGIGYAVSEKI